MRTSHFHILIAFIAISTLLPTLAQQKEEAFVPLGLIPPAPVLSPEDALKTFKVAEGFVIEQVVTEPLVEKPVAIDFDGKGRMWVCEMVGYMTDIEGGNEDIPQGRIVILEDTTGNGKVDRRTVFLDKLLLPRAIQVLNDGILFADHEQLYHVLRDNDKPKGKPVVVDPTYSEGGNVEHKPNGLLRGLDNWTYNAKSDRRYRRTKDGWVMEKTSFRGQWGIAMDDYGRLFFTGNSNFLHGNYLAPQIAQGNPGVKLNISEIRDIGPNTAWPGRVTPGVNRAYIMKLNGFDQNTLDPETYKLINATGVAGTVIYRGNNFPTEWNGRAFSCESCVQLVKATDFKDTDNGRFDGNHPMGEDEFLTSTDERFRPVNTYNAPDGSLYIVDMYHGIIQHRAFLSKYLREQTLSRGLETPGTGHGRIYRVRHKNGAIHKSPDLEKLSSTDLAKQLVSPNGWNRDTAQRILVDRGDRSVVPLLERLAGMNEYPLGQIKAIWTLEGLENLNAAPILAMLKSEENKVVVSALWVSLMVTDPAEIQKLLPALSSLETDDYEVRIYLTRALGRFGPGPAFDALVKILKNHRGEEYVKQMAVAGLNNHELAFLDAMKKEFNDDSLEKLLNEAAAATPEKPPAESTLKDEHLASFQRGKAFYHGIAVCGSCHGADGAGMNGLGPPLDNSEWVTGKPGILIALMLNGMTGPVTVNGIEYKPTADMPGFADNPAIDDKALADIATYIRHEWNNTAGKVEPSSVSALRKATESHKGKAYTAEQLKAMSKP